MTPVQLAESIRFRVKGNATTVPDADIIREFNIQKDNLVKRVVDEVDEDVFGKIMKTSLVADQREYSLPQSSTEGERALKITRVEAQFDPDETARVKLIEIPYQSAKHGLTEDQIVGNHSNEYPNAKYELFRDAIYILSGTIVAVTNGLWIWISGYPDDISSLASTNDMSYPATTTTIPIPEPLHYLLMLKTTVVMKTTGDKQVPLEGDETKIDFIEERLIKSLKGKNRDRQIISRIPDDFLGSWDYDGTGGEFDKLL